MNENLIGSLSKHLNKIQESEEENKIEVALRKSLAEEEEAIAAYVKRAGKAAEHENVKLEKLFKELAQDEKIHAAMLKKALKDFGFDSAETQEKADSELADVTGVPKDHE